MHMSTILHTSETGLTSAPVDIGVLALHPELRTRPEDLRPLRTGTRSDLSFRTRDGVRHEVEVKRAPTCPECSAPVTSRTHKAHA
jgi:hypothetical protein